MIDQQAQTVHDSKTLGKRIKLLRGTLSQEEFAKKVGISRASLANYETGRTIPSKEVIEKIEEISGRIPPAVLAGEQLKIVGIEQIAEQLGLSDDDRLNLTKDEIAVIRLARLCDQNTLRDLSSTIVQGFAQNEQSKRLAIDETLFDLALLIEVADGKRSFLSGVQKGNLYAMIEELLRAAQTGK
ncbi:helix-turn-helix transcriptional regulator [Roseinatronobacter sp.]|uniref:helix-turn-helix transcriptional regulator n=1 Tax=Roseinatronobacter sp. TaxID=1945755 RepID=UPI0025E46B4A|nr:helix-turn-helix domain-containing protein [Roseibaca sp.]